MEYWEIMVYHRIYWDYSGKSIGTCWDIMGYYGIILGSSYSRFLRYMIYWESTGM